MAWTNQNPYSDRKSSEFSSSKQLAEDLLFDHEIRDADLASSAYNNYLQILMRDEDFKRSSPQAQVDRLMAAGMSRSAALAALQQTDYGSAQTSVPGTIESNKAAAAQNAIDAVNVAGNLAMQITSVIMSIPAFKMNFELSKQYPNLIQAQLAGYNAENRIKEGQATLQDMTIYAQQQYGYFMTALEEYEFEHPDFKRPNDWQEMLKFLSDLSDDGTDLTTMALHDWYYDFNHDKRAGVVLRSVMRRNYNEEYWSQWNNSIQRRLTTAKAVLADLDLDHTTQLISESISRMVKNYKEGAYTDEQIQVAKATYLEILARTKNIDQNTKKQLLETDSTWWDTMLKGQDYDLREVTNQVSIQQSLNELAVIADLPHEIFENRAMQMLYESRSGRQLAWIGAMMSLEQESFLKDNSGMRTALVMEQLNLTEYNRYNNKIFGISSSALSRPLVNYAPASQSSMWNSPH